MSEAFPETRPGIPATAYIRRNADGEVRPYSLDSMAGFRGDFIWVDGNFACDCNRGMFFAQVGGVDTDSMSNEEDEEAFPCGNERYSVRIIAVDDGRELYIDDNWGERPA